MLNFISFILLLFPATTPDTGVDKDKLLQLINNLRQTGCKCGNQKMPAVAPVTWNDQLAKAAYEHSADMNEKKYFSHTSKSGTNPGQRIRNAGYVWRSCGENIGYNYPSEQEMVEGWIKSPNHCKTMMGAGFKEMGVGRAGPYWTLDMGTRK